VQQQVVVPTDVAMVGIVAHEEDAAAAHSTSSEPESEEALARPAYADSKVIAVHSIFYQEMHCACVVWCVAQQRKSKSKKAKKAKKGRNSSQKVQLDDESM
jgi:hypothetical protein